MPPLLPHAMCRLLQQLIPEQRLSELVPDSVKVAYCTSQRVRSFLAHTQSEDCRLWALHHWHGETRGGELPYLLHTKPGLSGVSSLSSMPQSHPWSAQSTEAHSVLAPYLVPGRHKGTEPQRLCLWLH
ncbi:hypothetical protein P7K49_040994 [Saguinus oedipus]|uniref:Uncharacterized protein n=1 Tax=Saguinus oedipus TaxID=9490 RepID=A0ABQ9T9B9_SAGOE|nr:hypothetical protein P7K49_040994 [Saguinus oedipus]